MNKSQSDNKMYKNMAYKGKCVRNKSCDTRLQISYDIIKELMMYAFLHFDNIEFIKSVMK